MGTYSVAEAKARLNEVLTRDRARRATAAVGPPSSSWSSRGRRWQSLTARHGRSTLSAMHPLIEAHRSELIALARRRGVTGVRVFGSMRRGDARDDSDVDLLVTLAPGTSALALGGLLMDAQELLGRRVDVVTEASLHPALRERVLADAVPL